MSLHDKTRAELESCTPKVIEEDDENILVRCLDTYDVWAMKNDESVTPCLKRDGYWESWITSWFTRHIGEGDFVVDVGANCGYYTMLFERLSGVFGQVVAYEANPAYVELLKRTRDENGANFVIEPYALADSVGEIELAYPGEYTGSASIMHGFDPKWGETKTIKVSTTTLDYDFEGMTAPDLIKIDAESAEEVIWNGGWSLWNADRPPVVVLEYSAATGVYSEEFDKSLFNWGRVTRIGYNGIEEPVNPDWLKKLTDWDMLVVRRND